MSEFSSDKIELMRQKPFHYTLQIRGDTIHGRLCRVVGQSTGGVIKFVSQILAENKISMNISDTDTIDDVEEISETVSAAAFMTMETLRRVIPQSDILVILNCSDINNKVVARYVLTYLDLLDVLFATFKIVRINGLVAQSPQ